MLRLGATLGGTLGGTLGSVEINFVVSSVVVDLQEKVPWRTTLLLVFSALRRKRFSLALPVLLCKAGRMMACKRNLQPLDPSWTGTNAGRMLESLSSISACLHSGCQLERSLKVSLCTRLCLDLWKTAQKAPC